MGTGNRSIGGTTGPGQRGLMVSVHLLLALGWAAGCKPGADPGDKTDHGDTAAPLPLTPASFSPAGQAALEVLAASHADERFVTWNYSSDAVFAEDWILQVPGLEHWGGAAQDVDLDLACAPAPCPDCANPICDAAFHPDFRLRYCDDDRDCVHGGTCQPVQATVERLGGTPDCLCVGASDYIYDEMYLALTSATSYADISSLDFPDSGGRFLAAIRNALRVLDERGDAVTVRMVFGWLTDDFALNDEWAGRVAEISEGIGADTSLNLYFAALNTTLISWNHSKIVAADGQALVEGGINFYTPDYLGLRPVHDLSLKLSGEPAADGHRYLDRHWRAVCDTLQDWDPTSSAVLVTVPSGLGCPGDSPATGAGMAEQFEGGPRVISLGRHGLLDRASVYDYAASDDAMFAAISAATSSLRFSLQDLGPIEVTGGVFDYDWPRDLMRRIAERVLDGVEVWVVLSNDGAGAYSYGWSLRDVLVAWRETIRADNNLLQRVEASAGSVEDFLCDGLQLASVRMNATDTVWPSDGTPMANHAKFFMVDDSTFYIGSQNLYLANLFEWGLFIDDPDLAAGLKAAYWEPLWTWSRASAASGPEALGGCVLR